MTSVKIARGWFDDVTAVYGQPRITSDGRPPAHLRDDDGDHIKQYWVWFPAGFNHNISIKDYGNAWTVAIGSHLASMPRIDFRTRTAPTDELMRDLIRMTGFTGTATEVSR